MSADVLFLTATRLNVLRTLDGGQRHEEARVELGSFIGETHDAAVEIAERERGSISPDTKVIQMAERLAYRAIAAYGELQALTEPQGAA